MAGRCVNPDSVRPNPTLGTYYLVPSPSLEHHNLSGVYSGPACPMLVSFSHPPSSHRRPDRPRNPTPTFRPGTIIGPVAGVDHAPACTAVLVHQRWVIVWTGRRTTTTQGVSRVTGFHWLRPIPLPLLRRYTHSHLFPFHPTNPDNLPHPFVDLWHYARELGLSHVSYLSLDSRPKFLLTGPVWSALYDLSSRHQPWHPPPDAELRHWARTLHPRLDYPALGGAAGPHPRDSLTPAQAEDLVPRARIVVHLRRWVHRRRQRKSRIKRHLIASERILPPHVLTLANVVACIAECL